MTAPYFLIYASTAAHDFTQSELISLLTVSKNRNARLDITGLLLYSPGNDSTKGTFVQILEGPRADVQALYVKITRDPRHSDWTLIKEGALFQRRFSDWSMGFRDLSALKPSEVPGFNRIFLKNWTLKKVLAEPDPVLQLLYSFASV